MSRKIFTGILGLVAGFALLAVAPATRASEANEETRLQFNQPVQLPGNTVLPAGTYWFVTPAGPGVTENVVHIYNADRTLLCDTLETIPTTRTRTTHRTELVASQQANGPIALVKWFYPDRQVGHQFIYSPQREARLMANRTVEVLAKTVS